MSVPGDTLLYLSAADVAACALGPGEAIEAVEAAFAAQAAGTAKIGAKAALPLGIGYFFQTMFGTLGPAGHAGMKWFGISPDNPARGLPNIAALIVLSDIETGLPLAVMDGNGITGARTAAMTAAAAKRLAPPHATRAAFVGCGVQARNHAGYLRHVLPGLREAALLGRGAGSRDAFAAWLRDEGWEVRLAGGPDDALAGAEIAVSTVPEYPGWQAFLDPALLPPGAFAVGVDLGRSWLPSGYGEFGLVATDDAAQSRHLIEEGKLKAPPDFDADLAALVTGAHPGRHNADDRVFFVFAGHVLGDIAAASAVYHKALAQGIGTPLPR